MLNRFFIVGKISSMDIKGHREMYDLVPYGFPSFSQAKAQKLRMEASSPGSDLKVAEGIEFVCPKCGHQEYTPPKQED